MFVGSLQIYTFRTQLIQKQEELQMMLDEIYRNDLVEEEEIYEEEYLEEYEDDFASQLSIQQNEEETIEVIAVPSVKELQNKDKSSIINMIEEIEKQNQIILDCTNPPARKRRRKLSKTDSRKSTTTNFPVARNEELRFEKNVPKLVMRPSISEEAGIVLYSVENRCSVCGQEFSSEFKLKRHQLSRHQLKQSVTCCDQVFEFHCDYKKHQQSVHPKTVMCTSCGKVLKNRKTYIVHKRSHQSIAERRFRCSYSGCEKAFNFKLHLNNHERTHTG